MNELVAIREAAPVDNYRMSTDAASVCKGIVVATSSNIQGRKYVSVEGWQAIAIAHGCAAGSGHVEKVEGGVRAVGEVRRMSDGQLIATAEGFVGEDEPTWFGGQSRGKTLPKRADYAIRAMAQTRAISRACRSAFAHVVVMMNANLQTTPAEEVPLGGFDDNEAVDARPVAKADPAPAPTNQPARISDHQVKVIRDLLPDAGVSEEIIRESYRNCTSLEHLTEAEAANAIKRLEKTILSKRPTVGDILDDEVPY